jgi:hypothetical protein
MSVRAWHPVKVCYCHHVDEEVSLEAEAVYPAEWLPDGPPRLLARRCSHAIQCNLEGRSSCVWSGTNPVIDPFLEKLV